MLQGVGAWMFSTRVLSTSNMIGRSKRLKADVRGVLQPCHVESPYICRFLASCFLHTRASTASVCLFQVEGLGVLNCGLVLSIYLGGTNAKPEFEAASLELRVSLKSFLTQRPLVNFVLARKARAADPWIGKFWIPPESCFGITQTKGQFNAAVVDHHWSMGQSCCLPLEQERRSSQSD